MEVKEIYSNDKFKVLNVTLKKGEKMPLHEATSDAFIIPKTGRGRVSFSDRLVDIAQGETLVIKAHEPHKMEILEDFSSCIILEKEAGINFIKNALKEVDEAIY